MRWRLLLKFLGIVLCVGGIGYVTRDRWLTTVEAPTEKPESETGLPPTSILVSEQAQRNLGLTVEPLLPDTFWRKIPVPGVVVDRPGQSDRNIVAPATGVVSHIARYPGETVREGETLFTLKLLSESLQLTQTDLFKTTQDIVLTQALRKRLTASGGAVPESSLIEADNQLTRLQVAVKAYRQELLNRGFRPEMIDSVAEGRFVNEINITSPATDLEVQELKIDLGQQVQAGQTLCLLADHRALAIEGRAFRDETALLERCVQEHWPIEVDFQEDPAARWGTVLQTFHIRYLANTIDPLTRTFAFRLPLENQSRTIKDDTSSQTLWRYRPGQKVRLLVPVERLKEVFILPADAVTQDGSEAFIFTQNVNTFERKPVRILSQDRRQVVLANDGSLAVGSFVVQSAAAQLNRMLKSGKGTGVPKGYHIHADGALHKHEDEGK